MSDSINDKKYLEKDILTKYINIFDRYIKFLSRIVIKNEVEAEKYETPEIYNNYLEYKYAYEKSDTFEDYNITRELLEVYGFNDAEINMYLNDKKKMFENLEIDYRIKNLLVDIRRSILSHYKESNYYYKAYCGIPRDESEKILLDDLDIVGNKIYIHEINITEKPNTYKWLFLEKNIEKFIDKYPDFEYLLFLERPLTPYFLREAPQYTILRYDENILNEQELSEFFEAYNNAREYIFNVFYIPFFDKYQTYSVIQLELILFATTLNYFSSFLKNFSLRKYSIEDIYDVLDNYGLSNLKNIKNITLLRTIIENLYDLERVRGSDKVFDMVLSLVGDKSIDIRRYFLSKQYKTDNTGNTKIDVDKKYEDNVNLIFIEKIIKSSKLNSAIETLKIDYHDFVSSDDTWGGVVDIDSKETKYKIKEFIRKELLSKNFSQLQTKYISISKMIDIYNSYADMNNFVGLMFQLNDMYDNFLTKDSILFNEEFSVKPLSLFAAWSYINGLIFGVDTADDIILEKTALADIMYLRKTSDLLSDEEFIKNNILDLGKNIKMKIKNILHNEEIKKYLVHFNINLDETTIDEVFDQYGTNKNVIKSILKKLEETDDYKKYNAWYYLYKANVINKRLKYLYSGYNKYSEYLSVFEPRLWDYINPYILYNLGDRKEKLINLAINISKTLYNYFSFKTYYKYKFSSSYESMSDTSSILQDIYLILKEYMSIYTQMYKIDFNYNLTDTPFNKVKIFYNDYYINKSDIILHVLNINEKRLGEKYDKLFESFLLKEYYLFNITHERKSELNFSEKINKTSKNQINEEIVDYEDYADVTRNNNYIDTLSIVDTFEVIEN